MIFRCMHRPLPTFMSTDSFFLVIAEDDTDDAFLLESAISQIAKNWKFVILTDGSRLLAYLSELQAANRHTSISLIMLDINMPRKDGLQTLQEIRQMSVFDAIPVIGLSTTNDESTRQRFYGYGGNAFFQKPGDYSVLVDILQYIHRNYSSLLPSHVSGKPHS